MSARGMLPIDFAPALGWRAWLAAPGWAVVLVLGLALLLAAGVQWQRADGQAAQLRQELALVQAHLQQAREPAARAEPAGLDPQALKAMNATVLQLNRPWGQMLNALEAAGQGTLALLELQPDAKRGRLRGLAEARHPAAMLAYLERLKAQPAFSAVWVSRHELPEPDSAAVVRFEFELQWAEAQP